MKKRNLLNSKAILRLCVGSLLFLALLTTHHTSRAKRKNINQVVFLSAAPEACIAFQNPLASPGPVHRSFYKGGLATEWDVRVWVPVELAPDNGLCDSVAADYSMQDLPLPVVLELPNSIVAADIPEPEPLPVLIYSLFLAAFGLAGFFFGPAATKPLPQHNWASGHKGH